jgi:hypothetical protein
MTGPAKQNPGWQAGAFGSSAEAHRFHAQHASAEPLLQRLDGVQTSGRGWRARCPACEGRSRKLTVAEVDDRVLLHCFGGCKAIEVLEAVGLGWPDIMPPRHWPETPEERRQARRAIREAGWAAALQVLSLEARVALAAARQLSRWRVLSEADDVRLSQAVERISQAAATLVEPRR